MRHNSFTTILLRLQLPQLQSPFNSCSTLPDCVWPSPWLPSSSVTNVLVRYNFIIANTFHWIAPKSNIYWNTVTIILSENSVPEGADDFLKVVIKLCEDSGNEWYRVYLIRKMSERQGVEVVQGLAKQPEFSWLCPEEIKMQVCSPALARLLQNS